MDSLCGIREYYFKKNSFSVEKVPSLLIDKVNLALKISLGLNKSKKFFLVKN